MTSEDKERFLKKARKNFSLPPAFERPQYGRSKAGGIKSFFGYFFFKKSNCLPPSTLISH